MNRNNSIIISGSSHEELAREISQCCGIPLISCRKKRFANSEWNFKIEENIRNKDVFLIQTGTFDRENHISINDYIIETIIIINACRYSSCAKITLIMPNSGDRTIEIPYSYWVNEISREAHHHIIIAGDQDNRKLFDNFSAVHPSVENLSKKLSIEKLIQLIYESEMVYCLDSFGAHFAALMGKKTRVFSKNLPTLKRWAAHGKNVEYIFHD